VIAVLDAVEDEDELVTEEELLDELELLTVELELDELVATLELLLTTAELVELLELLLPPPQADTNRLATNKETRLRLRMMTPLFLC